MLTVIYIKISEIKFWLNALQSKSSARMANQKMASKFIYISRQTLERQIICASYFVERETEKVSAAFMVYITCMSSFTVHYITFT